MIKNYTFLLLSFLYTIHSSYGQMPVLVKDINTTPDESSDPVYFVALGDKFYFFASDATHGNELWESDGTGGGTLLVKDINANGDQPKSTMAIVANNALFFVADDGTHGLELWKSDGTANGTVLVKDINTGSGDAFLSNGGMVELDDVIYFIATDGTNGLELWKSDGTAGGTTMVKDINAGDGDGFYSENLYVFNDAIYFMGIDATNGNELWKSDGTTAGTALLKDINAGTSDGNPFGFYGYNNTLYFLAMDWEVWKTDGTENGTELLKSFGSGNLLTGNFIGIGSTVFFAGEDDINGNELWKTDGTATGTVLVKDIAIGTNSSNPLNKGSYIAFNDKLFFEAADASGDYELWMSDGTDQGTVIVKNINASASSYPNNFIVFDDMIFFNADDGSHGYELWKSDGTAQGTTLTSDINIGPSDFDPSSLFVFNNFLYMNADGGQGFELWKILTPSGVLNPNSTISYLQAYPNPTSTMLTVNLQNVKEAKTLVVYNSFGQKVKEIAIPSGDDAVTFDISELVTGVYYVNTTTSNGALKIVKN